MSNPELTITAEIASRPNTARFTLNQMIAGERSRSYSDAESAGADPLARSLFEIGGVRALLLRENLVVVTKASDADWSELIARVQEVIRAELTAAERSHRRVATVRAPGSFFARWRVSGWARVRVSPDVRSVVGWLLAALSVAQLFWIFPVWGTSRLEPLLSRFGTTLGLLVLWLVATEPKER